MRDGEYDMPDDAANSLPQSSPPLLMIGLILGANFLVGIALAVVMG